MKIDITINHDGDCIKNEYSLTETPQYWRAKWFTNNVCLSVTGSKQNFSTLDEFLLQIKNLGCPLEALKGNNYGG